MAMDIRRSYEILELDHSATEDEVKAAYKDIVNVWHPDRFSSNPRLKQKAEKKLKEVNAAYDNVRTFLSLKELRFISFIHSSATCRARSEKGFNFFLYIFLA